MKALTLRQPWAWLVIHGPKNIENRRWQPWETEVFRTKRSAGSISVEHRTTLRKPWRGEFAVHAGAYRPDRDEYLTIIDWAERQMDQLVAAAFEWPKLHELAYSALLGTAVLKDVLPKFGGPDEDLPLWRLPGQLGWVLDERRAANAPQPCPGARGLWETPWELQDDGSWRYAPDHYP